MCAKKTIWFYLKKYIVCVCVCVDMCVNVIMSALVDLWRSRGDLGELFLFLYLNVVSGDGTGWSGLYGKPFGCWAIPLVPPGEFSASSHFRLERAWCGGSPCPEVPAPEGAKAGKSLESQSLEPAQVTMWVPPVSKTTAKQTRPKEK